MPNELSIRSGTVQYGMVRYLLPYHVTFHDDRKYGIGAWFVFACHNGGEETHFVLIYFHLKTVIQQMNNNYDDMNHTATLEEMRIRFIELKELVYSNETITHYKKWEKIPFHNPWKEKIWQKITNVILNSLYFLWLIVSIFIALSKHNFSKSLFLTVDNIIIFAPYKKFQFEFWCCIIYHK